MYMLEVWKKLHNDGSKPMGYIDKIFKSKNKASEYYNKYYYHMRGLNALKNYKSDWDPNTRLFYVVRHMPNICVHPDYLLPPFKIQDIQEPLAPEEISSNS